MSYNENFMFAIENKEHIATLHDRQEWYRYMMMSFLSESEEPQGAWAIQEKFIRLGYNPSAATIGRYLKELDVLGFTVRASNKGRVLTASGKNALEEYNRKLHSERLHLNVKKEYEVYNREKLIEIYIVRKAIEIEAVRLCARNRSEELLQRLGETVFDYREAASHREDFLEPSLQFHVLIGDGSGNGVLSAILRLLISDQKEVERQLERLETRNFGLLYVEDHCDIYQSIKQRDEESAVRLLNEHFGRMLEDLKAKK